MTERLRCPSLTVFALGISAVWLVLYNGRFWAEAASAMWHRDAASFGFLLSLAVLVLFLQGFVLMLMPGRALPRALASLLFVVAALGSYFSGTFGVMFDREMVRNAFETDRVEVMGLLSTEFLLHLCVFGLLPAVLVWLVKLPRVSWTRQLRERLVFTFAGLAACAVGAILTSASYAVFMREHKPVRYLISPGSVVTATANFASSKFRAVPQELTDPGGRIVRATPSESRPKLMFLVVGETARAANFQLGGYGRATNPRLASLDDVVYFENVTSCGTSTAVSVPCMFSHLGRKDYTKEEGARYFNLLDMLTRGGVAVEWLDNNAGCKGVCARVKAVKSCPEGNCYDDVMLEGLKERLRDVDRDTVIVFHQIGSHGPAYHERYPRSFERFTPACQSNKIDRCSAEELVNAYDNTILYTDHNLGEQIELLKSVSDRFDTLLVYVSDHGESLGEQRLYLHGMPYAFAPAYQKEVPFLVWTSGGYRQHSGLHLSCLRQEAHDAISHDNLFHTVMGAFGLRNAVYDEGLDILTACRDPLLTSR